MRPHCPRSCRTPSQVEARWPLCELMMIQMTQLGCFSWHFMSSAFSPLLWPQAPALSGCANPRTWSHFSLLPHLFATPGTVMTASSQAFSPGVLQGLFLLPALGSSPPDLLSNAPLYLLTFTTSTNPELELQGSGLYESNSCVILTKSYHFPAPRCLHPIRTGTLSSWDFHNSKAQIQDGNSQKLISGQHLPQPPRSPWDTNPWLYHWITSTFFSISINGTSILLGPQSYLSTF